MAVAQRFEDARALVPQIAVTEEEVLRLEAKICRDKGAHYLQEVRHTCVSPCPVWVFAR
jgi:hypothetical protein